MIKRYLSTETNLDHNKYVLHPMKAEVAEEANGIFELEIELPKGTQLNKRDLITAPTPRGTQPFRVYRIVKTLYGIRAYARHIFYDLANALLIDTRPTNANVNSALQSIFTDIGWSGWTYLSDITEQKTAYYVRKNPVEAIIGAENSILNVWGGNLVRDNKEVRIYADGLDRGYEIRLGKNLIGIEDDSDDSNVVTRLYPTYEKDQVIYGIPEQYVDSPLIGNYPTPITKEIRVALTDDQKGYTDEQIYQVLRDYCNNLYAVDNVDKPVVNYKVDFVELSKIARLEQEVSYNYAGLEQLTYETIETLTYEQLEGVTTIQQFLDLLEKVDLYDKVKIRVKELDIDLQARVIKYQYDALAERYIKIELGGFKNSNQYQINNIVQQMKNDREKASTEYRELYDLAINQVTGNKGGYQITRLNANNEPYETLWMDTPDIETAVNVLRINQSGIAGSANGFNGPYNVAITTDGWVVAERILANQLSAISADLGTITAGKIQDADGDSYWDLDNKEIYLNVNELKIQNQDVAGRLSTIEGKADAVQLEFDQLEIGGRNLLGNGNFANDSLQGWEVWGITNRSFITENSKRYLWITSNTTDSFKGIRQPVYEFEHGKEYTISFTAKSVNEYNNLMNILIHQAGDGSNNPQISEEFILSTSPKRYSFTFTASGIVDKSYFNIHIGRTTGTPFNIYITDIMFQIGNKATDFTPSPNELYAGITRIDKDGINVSVSNSEINSQLAYNGLEVRDGDELVATFGEAGAVVPNLQANHITANNIAYAANSWGELNVGNGQVHRNITSAFNQFMNNAKTVRGRTILVFNVVGTIYDDINFSGLTGDTIIVINVPLNSKIIGKFDTRNNTIPIMVQGSGILEAGDEGIALIYSVNDTFMYFGGSLKMNAKAKNICVFADNGSNVVVENGDIINCTNAFWAQFGATIHSVNNRGGGNNGPIGNVFRTSSAGRIFINGIVPEGSVLISNVLGFVENQGTTVTPSAFVPPSITTQEFKAVFTSSTFDTLVHGTTSVDSYYGAAAAQNRWDSSMGWKDGRIRVGGEVYNFFNGGTAISIRMRLRRKNTTHGNSGAVYPAPYNHSASYPSGAVRGGWTGWATVPSSLFTSGGATLTYYNGVSGSAGYAIWDAIEIEVTVTKNV